MIYIPPLFVREKKFKALIPISLFKDREMNI